MLGISHAYLLTTATTPLRRTYWSALSTSPPAPTLLLIARAIQRRSLLALAMTVHSSRRRETALARTGGVTQSLSTDAARSPQRETDLPNIGLPNAGLPNTGLPNTGLRNRCTNPSAQGQGLPDHKRAEPILLYLNGLRSSTVASHSRSCQHPTQASSMDVCDEGLGPHQ